MNRRKLGFVLLSCVMVLAVAAIVSIGASHTEASANGTQTGPTISTSKDAFLEGEDVVVQFSGFTEDYWAAGQWTEIDIHKKGNVVGTHSPLKTHIIKATSQSAVQSGLTEGTITFPEDDNYYGDTNWPLPAGEYYACLRTGNTVVGEPAYFWVVDPDWPTVQLSKDTYEVGEDIVATYAGFTEDYWGSGWAEIDILRKGEVVGTNGPLKTHVVKATGASYAQSGLSDATITFPEDDNYYGDKNWPLAAGEYYIYLRADNKIVGRPVYFTVVEATPPTLTLNDADQQFVYGESISFTYDQVSKDQLFPEEALWVSVALMKEGDVVGTKSSAMEHIIFADNASWNPTELEAATITFPEADNGNSKVNWPLAVGKYYAVVRVRHTGAGGNSIFEDTICNFEVVAPKAIAQPELKDSITMHYTVEVGDGLTGTPSMTFTLGNGAPVVVTDYTTKAANGLVAYTFAFDHILPQQMTDNIAAEFMMGDTLVWSKDTYSLQTYAKNKLEDANSASAHKLLVAMLNYGAEAQNYFKYNEDNLANAGVDQSILTNEAISGAAGVATLLDGTAPEGYAWKAVTLNLQSTLSFRLKFVAEDISKVVIKSGSNTWTFADNSDCFVDYGNHVYYFYSEDVFANRFSDAFDIEMIVDGVSAQTVHYSVNTYIAYISGRGATDVTDICTAIYNYGIHAAAYNG